MSFTNLLTWLRGHVGGRGLLAACRAHPVYLVMVGVAAVVAAQVYFAPSVHTEVQSKPPPATRESDLERQTRAKEALRQQQADASQFKDVQTKVEGQDKTIKDLTTKLAKADQDRRQQDADRAEEVKRAVAEAARTAAIEATRRAQGQKDKSVPRSEPRPKEPPKRDERPLPVVLPGVKLRVVDGDVKGFETPPLANRGEVARILPTCFANGKIITGLAPSSRAGGKIETTWSIAEEVHCPHQLLGPGARPRPTALPVQGCQILGEGVGNLATSRVEGRGKLLACVLTDGSAFEEPVEGYITDVDGSYGAVAEIFRPGSATEFKIFLTAVLDETATALAIASSKLVVTQGYGGPPPGLGVQKGFDKVIDLYLQQMEYLMPVLWARSNTPIRFVFTKGVSIPGLPTSTLVRRGG